jgi:hypothetical protein
MATKQSKDAGQAEVQKAVDEATEKGYVGTLPDGRPDNDKYTLTTGPKSPDEHEVAAKRQGR